MSTCNRLDLQTLGSQPRLCPTISPITAPTWWESRKVTPSECVPTECRHGGPWTWWKLTKVTPLECVRTDCGHVGSQLRSSPLTERAGMQLWPFHPPDRGPRKDSPAPYIDGRVTVVILHKVHVHLRKTIPMDGFLENEPVFGRVKFTLEGL